MTQIHTKVDPTLDAGIAERSPLLLAAKFSAVSITVIYSFLAIESFLNYQIYQQWKARHSSSPVAQRFLSELGDEPTFERLKLNSKLREVPARLRTYCRIMAYPEPHTAIPDTWRRLSELVDASRHFLVHAYPDPEHFQRNMSRIMGKTQTGEYSRVAEEVLSFLLKQSGLAEPAWIRTNTLLELLGIRLLPAIE